MRATTISTTNRTNRILLNTEELKQMLGCGRAGAVKVGIEAGARVKIGRRVFWNPNKITSYIELISE